jgi:diaminopimelate epimerase
VTPASVHRNPAWLVDVGVPHLIVRSDAGLFLKKDFVEEARALRFHPAFAPAGTNVNYAEALAPDLVAMRTYERGIEDEVLSCSSGSWAALHALAQAGIPLTSPLRISNAARSPLTFEFALEKGAVKDVRLTGDARLIFMADIEREAWTWGV